MDVASEARRLLQGERRRWFEHRAGREPWFTAWLYVYDDDRMGWLSCYLVPAIHAADQLLSPTYGEIPNRFAPGFDGDGKAYRYARYGQLDGYEPLVHNRYWYGLLMSTDNVAVSKKAIEAAWSPYLHSDMSEWGYDVLTDAWALAALDVIGIAHRGIKTVHCPMHDDRRASAGMLQGASGWVLSCRACHRTWGVALVYATVRHQVDPRGPSLRMWWTRLLHETGMVQLPEVAVAPADGCEAFRRVVEGITLATRVMLHNRHDRTRSASISRSALPRRGAACRTRRSSSTRTFWSARRG